MFTYINPCYYVDDFSELKIKLITPSFSCFNCSTALSHMSPFNVNHVGQYYPWQHRTVGTWGSGNLGPWERYALELGNIGPENIAPFFMVLLSTMLMLGT